MNLPPLFRTELFWTAVVGIVSMIVVAIVPSLEDDIAQLGPILLTIIGIALGGFTILAVQRQSIDGQLRMATIQADAQVLIAQAQAAASHAHG